MAEQLHCSEIHSKNIENMLSKLYIHTYCIVHNVIKYTQNITSVHSISQQVHYTNYVTCVSGCFGDVKTEGASIDILTLQGLETNRQQKLSALRLTSQSMFYVVPTVYI